MNLARYAARSLRHYRRAHLPVVLGVAVATAVLTGALVVGDSVRGSLRDLTLQRLGRIDQALVTQQPFRAALADELAAAEGFGRAFAGADAAFLLRGSLSSSGAGRRYAGGVQVIGVSPGFKQHGDAAWVDALAPDTVAITAPLAEELGVSEGGEVVLRLPTVTALPADSPLGEKADTTIGKRLTIARVLPPTGLARFSLAPSQTDPRNAFLPLATVQSLLGEPGGANALLVDGLAASRPSTPEDADGLAESLRPTLADYGLSVEALAGGRVQVESNALVLPEAVVEAADSLGGRRIQPVTTYLANTLRVGDQQVVYSTVSGVDSTAAGGPLLDDSGRPVNLSDDEIALNDGAAERLGAVVGDTVTVNYYEPESTHGELVTASPLRLKLRAIFPLASAGGAPTCAADPRLTPTLQGVTDADSINDWDLPFELVEPITQDDEDYWDAHAATPKAFVSFALARRLWATRWGSVSLLRFEGETPRRVGAELREAINPAEVGFAFQPVKRQGLAAAGGSTPFDALFFGFSMFLIASAVMLIALLFGLGIENRAREVGLLSAVGWSAPRVRSALVGEGLRVAAAGVVLGVPVGVLYAGLMIWGLTTLWVEAIVTPFLSLHARWQSLAVGGVVGLAVAWATISLVVRRLVRRPPRALLAGLTTGIATRASRGKRLTGVVAVALAGAAVGLPIAGNASGAQADVRAGYFFGGGAALLASLLLGVHGLLSRETIRHAAPSPFRLASLAWRNVARNRGRSLLTLALVGAASFLLLAISAFRLDPSEEGTGGYALVGQSDQPVHFDLNTDQGRLELGLGGRDEEQLDGYTVRALRVHDGEDASCLNLYQTRQPRVLGVPDDVIKRGGFSFAASAHGIENPWSALTAPAQPSTSSPRPPAPGTQPPAPGPESPEPIPVLLDLNTAMYSLKLYGGVGSTFTLRDEAERAVQVVVAGLLKNSLLQGDVLMSEANFLRLYPSASGSRFFLIEPTGPGGDDASLAGMLEDRLSDYGMDLERADVRLARFLAVQNTYLTTFQTIGGFGLLLGAVGVAVVQLRNLSERRGELALLRAGGFAPGRLRGLILRENLLLLGGGLAVGAAAAALALAPQAMTSANPAGADARLPLATATGLLAAILAIGLAVGAYATRVALRPSIIPALRGD